MTPDVYKTDTVRVMGIVSSLAAGFRLSCSIILPVYLDFLKSCLEFGTILRQLFIHAILTGICSGDCVNDIIAQGLDDRDIHTDTHL